MAALSEASQRARRFTALEARTSGASGDTAFRRPSATYSRRMAYLFALVLFTLFTFLSTGCFAVGGGSNGYYYGGGGVGLFAIIIIAAILFGKRRR